jgi:hypothetical protein
MAEPNSVLQAVMDFWRAVGEQLLVFAQTQGASLLMVFLAVVAAFYVNHRIQVGRHRLVARRMRQAIIWEAEANKSVLDESFRKFLDRHNAPDAPEANGGETDVREFDTSTSGLLLHDRTLLEYVSGEELKTLAAYARAIRVANQQRHKIETIRSSASDGCSAKPVKNLESTLLNHLLECEDSIKAVIRLGGKANG